MMAVLASTLLFLLVVLIMIFIGSIGMHVKNKSLKEDPFKVLNTLTRLGLLLGASVLIIIWWKIVIYVGVLLLFIAGLMLVTVIFVAGVMLFMLSPALVVLWVYNKRPMREREWQNSQTYSVLVLVAVFTSFFIASGLLSTLMEIPAPVVDSMMNQLAHWAL